MSEYGLVRKSALLLTYEHLTYSGLYKDFTNRVKGFDMRAQ